MVLGKFWRVPRWFLARIPDYFLIHRAHSQIWISHVNCNYECSNFHGQMSPMLENWEIVSIKLFSCLYVIFWCKLFLFLMRSMINNQFLEGVWCKMIISSCDMHMDVIPLLCIRQTRPHKQWLQGTPYHVPGLESIGLGLDINVKIIVVVNKNW